MAPIALIVAIRSQGPFMTLDNLLAGFNVGTAITAIIAGGALLIAVGFVAWAVDLVATFFENRDSYAEGTADQHEAINDAGARDASEHECSNCATVLAGVELVDALGEGSCPHCGEHL